MSRWLTAAQAWLALDPDEETAASLSRACETGDEALLRTWFSEPLRFGTGGMRAPMGPGPAQMNRVVVQRLSFALASVLVAEAPDARERGVAIAWDARKNSAIFAEDAARVLAHCGFRVFLSAHMAPTPVLSFATRYLGAVAGLVITASHNPAADNGCKVFDAQGAQITEPFDAHVTDRMAALQHAIPLSPRDDPKITFWPASVREAYFAGVAGLRASPACASLPIVYTPLHGVGGAWTPEALRRAGHAPLLLVASQQAPDPAFPTLRSPNPETLESLALAREVGERVGAHLLLANDPDADRVAVEVRHRGVWHRLSGNEVGALLVHDVLRRFDHRQGVPLVVTTIVSTAMIAQIARAMGAVCIEVLTGFKWIAQKARERKAHGEVFAIGVEESLGYSVGSLVADKDGVATAVLIADLAGRLAAEGLTLVDALARLEARFGRYVSRVSTRTFEGGAQMGARAAKMAALRADPPQVLAGERVCWWMDLEAGILRDVHGVSAVDLPRSDVLGYGLEHGGRVWVRPSGTESKIKFYAEIRTTADALEAESHLQAILVQLRG